MLHKQVRECNSGCRTVRLLTLVIAQVCMDRNSPDSYVESAAEGVRDTEVLIQQLAGQALVRPVITPRFVPSCTPKMLQGLCPPFPAPLHADKLANCGRPLLSMLLDWSARTQTGLRPEETSWTRHMDGYPAVVCVSCTRIGGQPAW